MTLFSKGLLLGSALIVSSIILVHTNTLVKDASIEIAPTPTIGEITPTDAPSPTATPSATPIPTEAITPTPDQNQNDICNNQNVNTLNLCLDNCNNDDCKSNCEKGFDTSVTSCAHVYLHTDPTTIPLHRVE